MLVALLIAAIDHEGLNGNDLSGLGGQNYELILNLALNITINYAEP